MRNLIISVCTLGACGTANEPEFSRVDNQSGARLVLVDDGHWDHGDATFHIACASDSDHTVSVNVDGDELVIVGTDASKGTDCDVFIVDRDVEGITVTGDGDL